LLADLQPPDPGAGNGYDEFLLALRAEIIEFAKPVVLVHGDSHYFRIDKPLLDRNGNRIEWFTGSRPLATTRAPETRATTSSG